jgi:hypothetical protein
MQLKPWERECLTVLGEMATGSENAWNKGKSDIYLRVLQSLGEEASRRAVQWAVLNEEWRPAPAKLRKIAANLYSPIPPVGQLWTEMWNKAISTDHRDWTHPILRDLTKALGGYRYLRSVCWGDSDPRFKDNLQRRFEEAYREQAEIWWQTVADQLCLPAAERDPHYFPAKRHAFQPPKLIAPASEKEVIPPPISEIKERLRELGADSIGNGAKNGKESERG